MQNARVVMLVGYFALIDKRIGRLRRTWLVTRFAVFAKADEEASKFLAQYPIFSNQAFACPSKKTDYGWSGRTGMSP
jgi:hypothetical protein